MTPADLKAFAEVMREMQIHRVSGETGEGEDFCIEMDPSAFGRTADASETPNVPTDLGAGEKKCACGHLQDSEHLNGLCIAAACPFSVCHPEATAKGATG